MLKILSVCLQLASGILAAAAVVFLIDEFGYGAGLGGPWSTVAGGAWGIIVFMVAWRAGDIRHIILVGSVMTLLTAGALALAILVANGWQADVAVLAVVEHFRNLVGCVDGLCSPDN